MNSPGVSIHLKLILSQGHPAFAGKPLAVCHSNSAVGTAEISSCNYAARHLGIKAAMGMSKAKSLCPSLLVLPYEVGNLLHLRP